MFQGGSWIFLTRGGEGGGGGGGVDKPRLVQMLFQEHFEMNKEMQRHGML